MTIDYSLQIALLRRAVEKFKSQLVTDNSSVCSDPSPKTSLSSHHRITPSNLAMVDHVTHMTGAGGKRVTTAAIVSHEMDSHSASTLVRKSSRSSLSKSSHSQELRAVKWKDATPTVSSEPTASTAMASPPTAGASAMTATPLREVNASLARLDRKMMHLETLLAKLTDRLSQQQPTLAASENEVQQAHS